MKRKEKIQKVLITSLINSPSITKISYANPPPLYDYSHIKTTPLFCHEQQRVSTSSRHLIIINGAIIMSSSSKASGDGEGDGDVVKPPMTAYRRAIQPTLVFT